MSTNNAETTEQTSAEVSAETNQAVDTDTEGTTETTAIEAGDTATGDESSSVEGAESSGEESELFYEFDGEEVSASTIKEWKDNGLRQSDYTKKSQANAEARKQLEAKHQEIDSVRETLNESISKLDKIIEEQSNPEDLEYLRDNDPSGFLKRQDEIKANKKAAEEAKAQQEELQKAKDLQTLAKEQELLSEALPTWNDPKVRKKESDLVAERIKDFSDEAYNKMTNHELIVMALESAKFRALQEETEETAKAVENAPNVVKATVKSKTKTKPKSTAELFYGSK